MTMRHDLIAILNIEISILFLHALENLKSLRKRERELKAKKTKQPKIIESVKEDELIIY